MSNELFLKYGHLELSQALSSPNREIHEDARKVFRSYLSSIESVLGKNDLTISTDMNSFSLGNSEVEIKYRKWCLENNLFLNPLNDLGPHSIAARDILHVPNMVLEIDEGPHYHGLYNQMKQEFVSARSLYYIGINEKKVHFSDKDVLLFNTLDYPSYSLSVEKVKISFRMTYSLFDKIAFFLNQYMALSIPKKKVSFSTFWYVDQKRKEGLKQKFTNLDNWPLRGLFWLSKDLFEDKPGFKNSIEPDAQELNKIRNHLEHKYIKIHENLWSGPEKRKNTNLPGFNDALAFSIYREDFEIKTLRLLKMVRASMIYLSLAIHVEEKRKALEKDSKKILPRYLATWEDEWKK